MNKKVLFALIGVLLFALTIVFLLVWDAINPTAERTVYEVAVVIRGRQNGYWDSVKQGIDRAVSDMNVDLSYITLERESDAGEQAAAIMTELENGAQAIVVAPCADTPELSNAIDAARRRAIVVEIESEAGSSSASVLTDNTLLGQTLADELLRRNGADKTYAVLLPPAAADCIEERFQAFEDRMDAAGAKVFRQTLRTPVPENFQGSTYYVALDSATMHSVAPVLATFNWLRPRLSGIGGNAATAYYLEKGVIEFAIADNAYSLGYVGIKSAVDLLKGERTEKRMTLDFAIVTAQNIYDTDMQRMLFPFVK